MKDLFAKFIPTLNVYNDSRPSSHLNKASQGFPDSPRVKNLPCNAGHVSSIHCWGIKVPQHTEQLTPIPQLLSHVQQRKIRVTHEDSATNTPHAVTEIRHSQVNKYNIRFNLKKQTRFPEKGFVAWKGD